MNLSVVQLENFVVQSDPLVNSSEFAIKSLVINQPPKHAERF